MTLIEFCHTMIVMCGAALFILVVVWLLEKEMQF